MLLCFRVLCASCRRVVLPAQARIDCFFNDPFVCVGLFYACTCSINPGNKYVFFVVGKRGWYMRMRAHANRYSVVDTPAHGKTSDQTLPKVSVLGLQFCPNKDVRCPTYVSL